MRRKSTPPSYTIDRSWSTNVQELYWNDDNGNPNWVPGLDGIPDVDGGSGYATGPYNNIATESLGYIKLTAGAHRFHVDSDDGFQLRSGAFPADVFAQTVGVSDGSTFHGNFDFMVEADGLYPIRNLWYENGGSAAFRLTAVDPCTLAETDINDPADPSGVVKVFTSAYQLEVYSSASVTDTFTLDGTTLVNRDSQTITVSRSLSKKFYKIAGPSTTKIDSARVSGGNVIFHYKFQ